MSSIVITGSTGFIGRHLLPVLKRSDHKLTIATRRPLAPSMEGVRTIVTGPLETSSNLEAALAGSDTVIHLAGLSNARAEANGSDPYYAPNVIATQRLADAAARTGVAKFINISSLFAVTGNVSDIIIDDRQSGLPPTAYGRSKSEAEGYVHQLANSGVLAISLRPPLVIGVDANGNWARLQRLAASGLPLPFANVKNRRSFVSVDTLASAIAKLCATEWPSDKSGAYCLADPEAMSFSQVLVQLRLGMGLPPRLVPFPTNMIRTLAAIAGRGEMIESILGDLCVDSSRFCKVFNFTPQMPLAEAIQTSGRDYQRAKKAA